MNFKYTLYYTFFLLLVSCTSACNFFAASSVKDKIIAEVGDNVLYYNQIEKLLEEGATPKDSAEMVNNIANDWVRHQLVLKLADENKGANASSIDKQVKDYTESLLIYNYENELIRYKLDSVLQVEEVEKYYTDNIERFVSTNDLVRCVMIKTKLKAPLQDTLRLWLQLWDEQSPYYLDGFCNQYAESCYLQFNNWISTDKITMLASYAPLKLNMMNKGYYETKDSVYKYFVKVFDTKPQGNQLPIANVRDDIRSQILNKRKTEFIKKVYDKIYQDGVKQNLFEIKHYDPKK